MAYTIPLRNVPSPPEPIGAYVKPDRGPTQQLFDYLKALTQCVATLKAAAEQVEPPEALESKTVAQLPAAAAGNKGVRYLVTDSNSTTFYATVAGGGANIVPVVSTGALWKIG